MFRWLVISLALYWVVKRILRIVNVVQHQDTAGPSGGSEPTDEDGFTDYEEVD